MREFLFVVCGGLLGLLGSWIWLQNAGGAAAEQDPSIGGAYVVVWLYLAAPLSLLVGMILGWVASLIFRRGTD